VQAPLQGPGSAAKSAAQPGLLGLLFIPGVAVKTVTIPLSRRGEIPFARLIHAKYMVVDGEAAWIGSSNWEDRYFLQSRNVAVLLAGPRLCSRLDRFFLDLWNSPYAEPLRAPQPR
jgi:phosphatidylserine/phosphatidylglycerophosphate/cardiolipin synthase-like enzyme